MHYTTDHLYHLGKRYIGCQLNIDFSTRLQWRHARCSCISNHFNYENTSRTTSLLDHHGLRTKCYCLFLQQKRKTAAQFFRAAVPKIWNSHSQVSNFTPPIQLPVKSTLFLPCVSMITLATQRFCIIVMYYGALRFDDHLSHPAPLYHRHVLRRRV